MTAPPLLSMRGIRKAFGPVQAVANADLTLNAGDILGLLGENGAGKTSLMNILFGTYDPDAGSIEIDGRPVVIRSSADALALGIGMVHQHFQLVPRHTVLENLLIGRAGPDGRLTRRTVLERLAVLGHDFHMALDPDRRVGDLSIGEQQRVEIAKCLVRGAKILILDEPTATLTPMEVGGLFAALRAMAGKGLGVVFISHKLGEVLEITNRITVMRAGAVVAGRDNLAGNLSRPELARLMVGRDVSPPTRHEQPAGSPLLALRAVSVHGRPGLRDVSITLRAGEIVGVAGVSGNGQRALADVIAGVLRPTAGSIEIGEDAMSGLTPALAQARGIGRVPEDRMAVGMIGALPLAESMVLPWVGGAPFSRRGILDRTAIRRYASDQIARFDVRTAGPDARTATLSGGNLQKALLARELSRDPRILLAAQPTRGIDVGATEFIHARFLALRERGGSVLLISEDLDEIFQLSDRIVVMYEGRIIGELAAKEATVEQVGLLMAGVERAA